MTPPFPPAAPVTPPGPRRAPATPAGWPRRLAVAAALAVLLAGSTALASAVEEGFEQAGTTWKIGDCDVTHRVVAHVRTTEAPHRGKACERIVLEAASGTTLRLELPVQPARVIDEWRASVWVRADRPDIRVGAIVRLPAYRSARTGQPVTLLVPGRVSLGADRWEQLAVAEPATALRRALPALRAEHGPSADLSGAEIVALVLDLYSRPGHYDVSIDDLEIGGIVPSRDAPAAFPAGPAMAAIPAADQSAGPDEPGGVVLASADTDAAAEPAAIDTAPPPAAAPAPPGPVRGAAPAAPPLAWNAPAGAGTPPSPFATGRTAAPAARAPADPVTGINRGVLEVAGEPFFPRVLDHSGEPFEAIAALGFNAVRLPAPASGDQIDDARRTGLWIVCPPPQLPEVDVRRAETLPVFSKNWDRVLLWDMGTGLAEGDVERLAEHARRVRTCDQHAGRPLVASADSGLRSLSRHVDMLVARRTVLGTSMELGSWHAWLRDRPRLARPGTPFLATLSTELDPRTARQAASLAGIGAAGLAVDPESLGLASLAAVAAGSRGLFFTSTRRIDGDDHESRLRAAAARAMNLRLRLLEPWAAAGRFSTAVTASDPEVRGVVLEAARARMVVAWRDVQGSQVVASHYHGDMPAETAPVTLLLGGIPEAHQAWEVSPGGLRPLRHRRVTGGVSVVVDPFRSQTLVLVTGDPAVAAWVQSRLREQAGAALASSRERAALLVADAADLLGRIPPLALGRLPVPAMVSAASQDSAAAEALAASDPSASIARYERAAAIAGQVERLVWEKGVVATGSIVAGPLATSDATLVEHWRFVEALAATSAGPELLPGGGMEKIDELASGGWRHFALDQKLLRTGVEVSRSQPAGGGGCLVIRAEPVDPAAAPPIVETPPVWITTPPVAAPSGKLVQIEARVWVPAAVKGSVDGLLVFDSIGGPALAERVGPGPQWRRLVLYRIVPPDPEPLSVTFALTGMGEARIDEVSVRVLERGGGPMTLVSNGAGGATPSRANPFPSPQELLAPPAGLPAAGAAPSWTPGTPPGGAAQASSPSAWPGMNLEWPKLPFASSSNQPPPGPGGGRIDPFKRAGVEASQPAPRAPDLPPSAPLPEPPLPDSPFPPEEAPLPPADGVLPLDPDPFPSDAPPLPPGDVPPAAPP